MVEVTRTVQIGRIQCDGPQAVARKRPQRIRSAGRFLPCALEDRLEILAVDPARVADQEPLDLPGLLRQARDDVFLDAGFVETGRNPDTGRRRFDAAAARSLTPSRSLATATVSLRAGTYLKTLTHREATEEGPSGSSRGRPGSANSREPAPTSYPRRRASARRSVRLRPRRSDDGSTRRVTVGAAVSAGYSTDWNGLHTDRSAVVRRACTGCQ